MSATSVTEIFVRLGAPLVNQRWSWGAIRASDGAVLLRVWQDQTCRVDDARYVLVANHAAFAGDAATAGYQERIRHLEAIRGGAPSFLVMVEVKDPKAEPRTIKSVNDREVFTGGRLLELDQRTWLELVARKPLSEIARQGP